VIAVAPLVLSAEGVE
jgi:hypothetical protein